MSKTKKVRRYSKRVCAIDPGGSGGLAVVHYSDDGFLEIDCAMMMPTVEVMSKKTVDGGAIVRALGTYNVSKTVIEYVTSRPGQGVASSFQFGRMFGAIEGAVRTVELPVYVTPATWKNGIGLPTQKATKQKYLDKGFSIAQAKKKAKSMVKKQAIKMATRLYGEEAAAMYWSLAKEDGVAEAALIAAWYLQEHEI